MATVSALKPSGTPWPRRRTPLLMQLEATDCGAACLGIVLAHYGCWVSLESLREECAVGRDGSNLEDIAIAARKRGMTATGWSAQISGLARLPMPMILYWGFKHFVVLEGIGRRCYYVNDPAEGHRVVDEHVFNRDFTGVGLVIQPGPSFRREGTRPRVLRRLWPWLRDDRPLLARAAIYGLLLALISLALPLLLAAFVDRVLEGSQPGWHGALVAAMFAAAGLTCVLTWLQMRSLRELVVRLSIKQSEQFLDRLLRLPLRFFAHRLAGDLATRMRLIDQVVETGAGQVVHLLVDLAMSMIFLAAMLAFDFSLALVVAALGGACLVSIRILTRMRRDQNHQLRREQGLFAGMGAAGLKMIETLQATARENGFAILQPRSAPLSETQT